jgi:hypothetical protein
MKRLTSIALCFLFLGIATPSHSQDTAIHGIFNLDAQRSDSIDDAIETAVARMNILLRPFMRSRLRKLNVPYPHLFIEHEAHEVTFAIDSRPPIRTPDDGEPIQWTRDDGEQLVVSTKLGGRILDQTFAAKDGKRVNNYELSPDGKELLMHVTLLSHRFNGPVNYTLVYRRNS